MCIEIFAAQNFHTLSKTISRIYLPANKVVQPCPFTN
ncbi:hypothetical protein PFWH6_1883 [Pseudomonas fluorescens WH6]|nr:hypothetical protein PFWH6_1883 [Pseudomonas fluorescens WH6]